MGGLLRPIKVFSSARKNLWPALLILAILIVTAWQLHHQGRLWWCSCRWFLWTSDAWGRLTSQAFLDPYSFTHLLHGFAFAGLLLLLTRAMPTAWRLCLAIAMEAVWEVIENSEVVIQRYREATASLGYHGDTVLNSMGDILCCGLGLMIARRLGWLRSLPVFLATEIVLLLWIRDSLILEIIMLIHPINAIKTWQIGH